jgi:hypothetical protein
MYGTGRGWLTLAIGVLGGWGAAATAQANVTCGTPDATNTEACSIDPKLAPAALCNDGSQPEFSLRPGTGGGTRTWIIWLEGGGNCTDQASCAARAASPQTSGLITSHNYIAADGTGLLSPDPSINPTLYNATTVVVHYCSSDNWTGAATPAAAFNANDPTTWYFQGRSIALAAINSLQEVRLHFKRADIIVLGGTSAGGAGITLDANDILPILPAARSILLVNDAGFALDIGQFDPTAPSPYISSAQPDSFITNIETAMSLWGGRGDAKCAAAATSQIEQAGCYNTALLLQNGSIPLPSFVAESQLDQVQVTNGLCPTGDPKCPLPVNPALKKGIYVTAFGADMAQTLTAPATQAAYSFVAPDQYMHVIMTDDTAFTSQYQTGTGSFTPSAIWASWYANPSGARLMNISDAPGLGP